MLADDVRSQIAAANRRESDAWRRIRTREQWEAYRDQRLAALRESLGPVPEGRDEPKVRRTNRVRGDGFLIENLVFESRPGLWVTGNLYQPTKPTDRMPGFVICHSHHNPKTQGELQDMGMTWARQGCLVLVMDQIGHGERRQHPFVDAKSYPGSFRVGRQDYYFRYNVGIQLHLIGESLIGWMAWDLMRGVDVLLSRPGIDQERIILIGAVAGGGDPAAVAAALDPRITAAVPFNFGGPQPETQYPLPPNAEESFNYAGGGSWESTRNLRLSARDGFLPWVIVGAIAPSRLAYAHEFSWDREHDPVWRRLERVYSFYDARDHLGVATGFGLLSGRPPNASHCNNVGPAHRKHLYALFERWFGMPAPRHEYGARRPPAELHCWDAAAMRDLGPELVRTIARRIGVARAERTKEHLRSVTIRDRAFREQWARVLGGVDVPAESKLVRCVTEKAGAVVVDRVLLNTERDIVVPLLLLRPSKTTPHRAPVVIAVAQAGKARFLQVRTRTIAALLEAGVAVCLPDVRGTGETRPDDGRGRRSAATSISSSALMVGETLVGRRLVDLLAVMRYLRSRDDVNATRVALWGESFAAVNAPDRRVDVPLDASELPKESEPLGAMLALFGALFENDVRAVLARGGLVGFQSLLDREFIYVPHDCVVPGVLTVGDLNDVAAALAPRPVRLEALVDGVNRRVDRERLVAVYAPAREAYRAAGAAEAMTTAGEASATRTAAAWLLRHLR